MKHHFKKKHILRQVLLYTVLVIVSVVAPLMVSYNNDFIESNMKQSSQRDEKIDDTDSLTPSLRDAQTNLDNFTNPDVAYADYVPDINGNVVRIGAATNPTKTMPGETVPRISHMTSLNSTGTLTFLNNGVPTIYNSATTADQLNVPTKNIKVIDFASNTGIPMLTPSSPNGGGYNPTQSPTNEFDTFPIPYHLKKSNLKISSVDAVKGVVISDNGTDRAYSTIEEVGFYSFSGWARYFEAVNGTHGWYHTAKTADTEANRSTYFRSLESVKFATSDVVTESPNKVAIKRVRNGAFYHATNLKNVDFGYDNYLQSFDNPWGPYEYSANNAPRPYGALGDYGVSSLPNTWNGIFEGDSKLTDVMLYQRYYGWESDAKNASIKNKYHDSTLLNIPANMFKGASNLSHFNTLEDNTFAMPYSVKEIGDSALEGAAKINSVVFSLDIESIGRISGNSNDYIKHFTFPKPYKTANEIKSNTNLYNSLRNFVPNNCPGSGDFYIHVPYDPSIRSIFSSPYYQIVKENYGSSNIHFAFIRPKRFNFINWKNDIGTYNGQIGLTTAILNSDVNKIIVKPVPDNSYIGDIMYAYTGAITVSSPLWINWPNNGTPLDVINGGVAFSLYLTNIVQNSGWISGLKISVQITFDSQWSDGYANSPVKSESSLGKIGFFAVTPKSFTFSNDHNADAINQGYTSGSNVLSVRANTSGSFGAGSSAMSGLNEGDYKNITIASTDKSITMPLPGTGFDNQVGVSVSLTDFTHNAADDTGTKQISKPTWVNVSNVFYKASTDLVPVVTTKYTITVAPPPTAIGTYTFRVLATSNADPSQSVREAVMYTLNVWELTSNELIVSPDQTSFSDDENVEIRDVYHRNQFIARTENDSVNGAFVLPSISVGFRNDFKPINLSDEISYSFSNFKRYGTNAVAHDHNTAITYVDNSWFKLPINNTITYSKANYSMYGILPADTTDAIINDIITFDLNFNTQADFGFTPRTLHFYLRISYANGQLKWNSNYDYSGFSHMPNDPAASDTTVRNHYDYTKPYYPYDPSVPYDWNDTSGIVLKENFTYQLDYVYDTYKIKVSASIVASLDNYRYIAPGVGIYSNIKVEKSADGEGYFISWTAGDWSSNKPKTFAITIIAGMPGRQQISKTFTFSFWKLNLSKCSINNNESISFPAANTNETVVYDGVSYRVADSLRKGANSYADNDPNKVLFSHDFTYSIAYADGSVGYPTRYDSSPISAYRWEHRWYLLGTNSQIPGADLVNMDFEFSPSSIAHTGINISTNTSTGKGTLFWEGIADGLDYYGADVWSNITFQVGVKIRWGHQKMGAGAIANGDFVKILGKTVHKGLKPWTFNSSEWLPPSFETYNVSRPEDLVLSSTYRSGYAYNRVTTTGAREGMSGKMAMPVVGKLYGYNVPTTAYQTWKYELINAGISNLPSWLHIAQEGDPTGYQPGTIYWDGVIKEVQENQVSFFVKIVSIDDSSFYWQSPEPYTLSVSDIPSFDWTYIDSNISRYDPSEYFKYNDFGDNIGVNFLPSSTILLRSHDVVGAEPNRAYIDLIIDTGAHDGTFNLDKFKYNINIVTSNKDYNAKFKDMFLVRELERNSNGYFRYQIAITSVPITNTPTFDFTIEVSSQGSNEITRSVPMKVLVWNPKSNPVSSLKYEKTKYTVNGKTTNSNVALTSEPTYKNNVQTSWNTDAPEYKNYNPLQNTLFFSIAEVKKGKVDITDEFLSGETYNWFYISPATNSDDTFKKGVFKYYIDTSTAPKNMKDFNGTYTFKIQVKMYDIFSSSYKSLGPVDDGIDKNLLGKDDTNLTFNVSYNGKGGGGDGFNPTILIIVLLLGGGIGLFFFWKRKRDKQKNKVAVSLDVEEKAANGGAAPAVEGGTGFSPMPQVAPTANNNPVPNSGGGGSAPPPAPNAPAAPSSEPGF